MKTLRYITTIFLFIVSCACAMDPTMVMYTPKKRFDTQITQKKNYIDELPLELQGKIIKDVFNLVIHEDDKSKKRIDQEKLSEYVLHIPLILGIKCAQEFCQFQKMCQDEIGGKSFLAQELYCLPREPRDIFVRMANRSKIKLFIEGNIDDDDFENLVAMKNEDIKKGLKLATVRKGKKLLYCIYGAICMSFQWFPMVMMLPEYDKQNSVERVAMRISMFSFAISLPLLLICGCFYDQGKGVEERFYRG